MKIECPYGECDGSGEVPIMSAVYPNEPHMADLGETRPCICKAKEPADMSGADNEDR